MEESLITTPDEPDEPAQATRTELAIPDEPPSREQEDDAEARVSLAEFFRTFFHARGTTAIVIITLLVGVGTGATIGVIPEVMADRYARLHHGYDGPPCASLLVKPPVCQQGTDDAQAAASYGNLALSIQALLFSPIVGSFSDGGRRRPMILASILVQVLPAVLLWAVLLLPHMHPLWFYLSNSFVGAFNYMALVFAALADVLPSSLRAASNGVFFAVFYATYSVSPSIPLALDHVQTALVALVSLVAATGVALVALPETTRDVTTTNTSRVTRDEDPDQDHPPVHRPWTDMAILGRDRRLALLAASSLLISMVYAADHTLVLYYIEERLDVGDADIARMFLLLGVVGLLLSGGAIQPLSQVWGERGLLLAAMLCGTLHNTLYGLARSKAVIYAALTAAQFTKLNTPVLSALCSQGASPREQGQIQGALAALNSVGFSVGPLSMEFVYHWTKNKPHLGPGFMFYYGAMLYAIGVLFVLSVPPSKRPGRVSNVETEDSERNTLEEPLLSRPELESGQARIEEA